jgi:hypothetical protein
MKHLRINKQKNALKRINNWKADRSERDKGVFDAVLKTLYNNASSELDLEKEIFKISRIKATKKEAEHIWNVLTSSGWVMPSIGFGKAGKLELTRAGYQLMSQFGSYKEYLKSVEDSQKPQTIIMPIAIETETNNSSHIVQPPGTDNK